MVPLITPKALHFIMAHKNCGFQNLKRLVHFIHPNMILCTVPEFMYYWTGIGVSFLLGEETDDLLLRIL
jgi:hypothetical protein